MDSQSFQPFERHIAIDAHKQYVVTGGLNEQMEVVLPVAETKIERFEAWAQANLRPTDCVVIEATTNTWKLYDIAAPLAGKAIVANPAKVKLIISDPVRTDKRAVYALCRLSVARLIPEVWVPPQEVRELRGLIAHRRRLVRSRTRVTHRLHSLLHRHNLQAPKGEVFTQKHRPWWENLDLSSTECMRLKHDLATVDHLNQQIAEAEEDFKRLSTSEPWSAWVPLLIQLPGVGLIAAMTILAAIGDISRFPCPGRKTHPF